MPNQQDKFFATLKFLTIFPVSYSKKNTPPQLAMMPAVGLLLGIILYVSTFITAPLHPVLSALVIIILWFVSTGFLHADGLADLADGLAASHGDRNRLFEVMKEPHIGSFAALSLILVVVLKLLLITLLSLQDQWAYLLLIPAWSRLGAAWWAESLPSLHEGLATWLKESGNANILPWFILLMVLSLVLQPLLLFAPILLWAWKSFLSHKLGGMNGDCLGAGIEVCEAGLLFLCCMAL